VGVDADAVAGVFQDGREAAVCSSVDGRKINLSTVFAGQNIGIKEVSDKVWLVSFMQYDLGFFDHETGRITSAENPFGAKVLPMCPVWFVTDVVGTDPWGLVEQKGIEPSTSAFTTPSAGSSRSKKSRKS
jgi:hypothetical protein